MKLAVLMSTYNGELYLRDQIESLLSQKLSIQFDIYVRDDGSTDKTIEILKEYVDADKIKMIRGENVGAAKAFIYLLKEVKGYDYYAFSDQDDVWNDNKLQRGIDILTGFSGPALYCTNCQIVNSNLEEIGRNTHRKQPTYSLQAILCLASCAQGCTSVFNNKLAKIIQDYPVPNTFIMHDSLMTCVCALVGGKIIYDNNPSMKYRMHDRNVFGMTTAKQNKIGVIYSRINEIFKPKKITMYTQNKEILRIYGKVIKKENMKWCQIAVASEYSLRARLKMVLNKNLRHDTLNKTITKKLEILFGND